jgi:predicted transcriptional regulator
MIDKSIIYNQIIDLLSRATRPLTAREIANLINNIVDLQTIKTALSDLIRTKWVKKSGKKYDTTIDKIVCTYVINA